MTFSFSPLNTRIEVRASLIPALALLGFATVLIIWELYPPFRQAPLTEQLLAGLAGGGLAGLGLLVHELAHGWMCRRLKLGMKYIRFSGLVGGTHVRSQRPRSPEALFAQNAVGPLANLGLGAVLLIAGLGGRMSGWEAGSWALVAAALMQGLFLGLQLLPLLPADGGKMLEAGLWKLLDNRLWAIRTTTWGGSLMAGALMGAWGWWAQGWAFFPGPVVGGGLAVAILLAGIWQGRQYYQLHAGLDRLQQRTVREATEFFPVSVDSSEPVGWVRKLARPVWITRKGKRWGILHDGLESAHPDQTAGELACPLQQALVVSSQANLGEVIERVGREPDRPVVVDDEALGEGLLSLRQVFQQAGWTR